MPDYSLICSHCKERFSFFGSWEKRKSVVCPKCGSSQIEQEYTADGRVGLRQINKGQGCPMSEGGGCAGCKHQH